MLQSTRDSSARVALLAATLAGAAALLYLLGGPTPYEGPLPVRLPWWGVALLFALSELVVIHIFVRGDAVSVSFGEVPLLLGLLFAAPAELIAGQLLGDLVVLAFVARQKPLKLAFNLASYTFGTALAIALFSELMGGRDPMSAAGLVVASVAVLAAACSGAVAAQVVISLLHGAFEPRPLAGALGFAVAASLANAGLGLAFAGVLWRHTSAAWLLALPLALLFLGYRAYARQRLETARLTHLYRTSQSMQGARDLGSAVRVLLEEAVDVLHGELAAVKLLPGDGKGITRLEVLQQTAEGPVYRTGDEDEAPRGPWAAPEADLLRQPRDADALARLAADLGTARISEALVAPLVGEPGRVGSIVVANRLGAVYSWNAADVRLLDTLASTAGVALERERLGQTLKEVRRLQSQLKHQAFHDGLTGLANRDLFRERLNHALARARRSKGTVAVLFIDLDGFKLVNDSLGHHAGDDLLVAVGARLAAQVRPGDTAARLGGDEFAVLVEDLEDDEEAERLGRRVLAGLEKPLVIAGDGLVPRASIGVAIGAAGDDADHLLRDADFAMYRAKQAGGGRLTRFEPSMHLAVLDRLGVASGLSRALAQEEMQPYFQPIVDLRSGAIVAVEALARWQHPIHGLLLPARFIPAAEQSGLIGALDRQMLCRACHEAAQWDVGLGVNVSARSLQEGGVEANVREALRESELPADRLTLEVTESLMMQRHSPGIECLRAIRASGVHIAIDDFGTGFSSLSYLAKFPADVIKLDREMVADVREDEQAAALVQGVGELARRLGTLVVAEGVHDADHAGRLRDLGCELGQGFGLSPPARSGAVDDVLARASHGTLIAVGSPAG